MEPDSLSFLTPINKIQSHSVGGLTGLCFQDTQISKGCKIWGQIFWGKKQKSKNFLRLIDS